MKYIDNFHKWWTHQSKVEINLLSSSIGIMIFQELWCRQSWQTIGSITAMFDRKPLVWANEQPAIHKYRAQGLKGRQVMSQFIKDIRGNLAKCPNTFASACGIIMIMNIAIIDIVVLCCFREECVGEPESLPYWVPIPQSCSWNVPGRLKTRDIWREGQCQQKEWPVPSGPGCVEQMNIPFKNRKYIFLQKYFAQ